MENRMNFEEKIKALSVFKWTIRKQMPFSIAYWILLFLSFPVVNILIMIITNANIKNGGSVSEYVDVMEETAYPLVASVFSVIAIIHAVVLAIMTFSYLHNKRSVDLFGSLPVSRRTMFFSRYIALIVSNVVPILVFGTLGALLTFRAGTMLEVYKVLGILILATIGNISFIAFISLCCGTVGDVIVSYVVVNIVYPICVFICSIFPMSVVPGVPRDYLPATVYTLLSPVATHFTAAFGTGLNIYVVWWIVFWIVLIAGCYILCRKRKAETAQNAFAFTVVEIIIKFIACFAAGFGLGWIMTEIGVGINPMQYNGGVGEIIGCEFGWFTAGFLIGDIIANGMLHLIYHRGFSKFKSSLKECVAVFGTGMVLLIIVTSGIFGYGSRVPNIEDIESVHINTILGDDSDEFVVNGVNLLEAYYDDKETIEEVVGVHQTLVDNIDEMLGVTGLYPIVGYYEKGYSNLEVDSLRIKYKLKNGKTMTRYYDRWYGDVTFSKNIKEKQDIYEIALNNIPTEYITTMQIEDYEYNVVNNDTKEVGSQIKKVVDALKEDLKDVKDEDEDGDYSFLKLNPEKYNITFTYENSEDGNRHIMETYFYIDSQYKNTLKVLREMGYNVVE